VSVTSRRSIRTGGRMELVFGREASIDKSHTKGKVFPCSLPSVGPGADPGVQAVSPQVT